MARWSTTDPPQPTKLSVRVVAANKEALFAVG